MDEIIVEVAEEKAAEVAVRMQKLMLKAGKDILPDMLMSAEYALMRRWSKKAKAAYNDKGILIPFEDAKK